MRNILAVISLIRGGRRLFGSGLLLLALAGIGSAISPLFLGGALNHLTALATSHTPKDQALRQIAVLLGGYLLVRLTTNIFDWTGSLAGNRLGYNLRNGLRDRVITNLMGLPIDYFERQRIGEVMEKIGTGIGDMTNWVSNVLGFFFTQLVNLTVSLLIITRIEPWLGGVMLIITLINTAYKFRSRRAATPIIKQARKAEETASGLATEALSNMATVRSFGQEERIGSRIKHQLDEYVRLQYSADVTLERAFWTGEFVVIIASVIGLGVIAWGVVEGRHPAGDLLLGIIYFQNVASGSRPLGRLITGTIQTDASAGRIVELLSEPATVTDRPGAIDLDHLRTIEFDHVSFAYPGKLDPVLEDVSFTLPQGQTLALVGPSGVGKTTITKLLQRFYEPTGGRILINGRDITDFTQASVRRHMGLVMQDVVLFNDTVEANLQFARAEAGPEQLSAAAKVAHADVFIDRLPDGYQTLVGERGVRLSGGEKQRVAVARAVLRDPDLIILDEATSALDSESERYVQDGLQQLMSHRTAVVIAHRLSTVMRADQIIVMESGRIVDQGTHRQLTSKRSGLYARLYQLQTTGALVDEAAS
jgi:ABC-type multidrug transport system fused ATPase/permease subunit